MAEMARNSTLEGEGRFPVYFAEPAPEAAAGPQAQAAIRAGLDSYSRVTQHVFSGLDHGSPADTRARRDETGTALADPRIETFFVGHLMRKGSK